MNQFILDDISDNMDALLQTGKYGAINTKYTTKMGYYVIEFMSEAYTLQEEKRAINKSLHMVNYFSKRST